MGHINVERSRGQDRDEYPAVDRAGRPVECEQFLFPVSQCDIKGRHIEFLNDDKSRQSGIADLQRDSRFRQDIFRRQRTGESEDHGEKCQAREKEVPSFFHSRTS